MKKGWQIKKLSEVCEKITDGTHQTPTYFDDGVLFLSSKNVTSGTIDWENVKYIDDKQHGEMQRRVSPRLNDILLAKNGTTGVAAMVDRDVPFDIYVSLALLRPLAAVRPTFLLHFINSPLAKQQFTKRLKGIGVPNLHLEEIREVEIPVPPLAEQQRIVGLLDEAFEGLATAKAHAEKNLQNARALFESHLQSVFSQRGPGWVEKQLASLCHEITVGHVGSMKTEYKESGIPFLRSQNIRPFEVSMENAMFIDEAFHRALKKSQLRPGDLAIVRTGYPGTAAVIPPELPDSNCSDLVIVRPSKEVNPHFLAAFFNSAFGKQLVLGKVVGAAQKHFNITAAKEVMLHVPPITDQITIVAMVENLREETQRLTALYEQKLAALEALKKSLLHQAFAGEL